MADGQARQENVKSLAETVGFVHLRSHSAFSLLEGALPLKTLAKLAKADLQPALGLADTGNLFGALEFSEAMAEAGIQPIVGCQLAVDFADDTDSRPGGPVKAKPAVVVIAATDTGFRNLVRLVSRSYTDHPAGTPPHVLMAWLAEAAEGLIALTGGFGGPLDAAIRTGQPDRALARLDLLRPIFADRLYVELQRHGLPDQRAVETELRRLAARASLPLAATNEPYFPTRADFEAHDALVAIAEGAVIADGNRRRLTPEHYFKTRAEMTALFADLPEATQNTVEIARRVAMRPTKRKPILPRFVANASGAEADAAEATLLRAEAEAGLTRRLAAQGLAPGTTLEDYQKRLAYELGVIERMKYPGYFLIVADFIKWAKAEGIPVGPGRGSGAGSVVAWTLTITDLDPIRFGLLFERFLNPERVSMPDFDVDFCQDRRDRVIQYVQQRFGADRVAQIITFGTLQARAVLRDVGRVLEMPYGQVDRLTKLVPQNPANPVTLGKAIEDEPRLQQAREAEPIVGQLMDIALKLEGLYRHASTHAAGIVISDRPLEELVPLYRDPRSDMPVTQYNMKWVEQAGLVKFDFLGLKTLTVLDLAVRLVARKGIEIDLSVIPLDDDKTFAMLRRGETVGVFQVESQGMRRALVDMRPDRFEDLVALVALYRPGPMANIPTYCSRKLGREPITYIHPSLEPILAATYGVITYQEQVMRIAQDLAGYSLGEADLLRRAMGKKIRAEMEKQRIRFMSGATQRGIPEADAEGIFEACAKFADYGFNKSHSAPYALITYQTAYLKANHPVEFMAASMTLDTGNTDKLNDFRQEAQRLGITVEPPSLNRSAVAFEVADGRILYALAAVKGVGAQAVEHIVAVRGAKPFSSLADFAARINPRMLNRRVLESLVAAGAFDELKVDRASLTAGLDRVLAVAARRQANAEDGQNELFGGAASDEPIRLPAIDPWPPGERLTREHAAVGFYLSAHPLDDYRSVLGRLRVQSWAEFQNAVRAGAAAGRLAGTVVARQERRTKTGNKMGIIQFSDPTGQFEAIVFSEGLNEYRDMLEPGQSVVLLVGAEDRPEGMSLRIQSVEPIDRAIKGLKQIRVFVADSAPLPAIQRNLPRQGEGDLSLVLRLGEGAREVEMRLPGRFAVSPGAAGQLRAVPGVLEVELA
ncbi:MAG: DNA polymerase III subunit alpha [Bauldia sp.]